MKPLPGLRAALDHADADREPTAAELDAIERERPVLDAEVELLDVQIGLLDRTPTEWDERRLRRAHRRLLAARTEVANRETTAAPEGVA